MKTLKTFLFLCAILGVILPNLVQARTWTNRSSGKTVEADFVSATDKSVELKRDRDGKVFSLPISGLSQADQDFITAKTTKAPWEDEPETESAVDAAPEGPAVDSGPPTPAPPSLPPQFDPHAMDMEGFDEEGDFDFDDDDGGDFALGFMFYLMAVPATAVFMTLALFFAEMFSDAEITIVHKIIIGTSCSCVYFIPWVGNWAAIILCATLLTKLGRSDSFGMSISVGVLMVVTARLLFIFALIPMFR